MGKITEADANELIRRRLENFAELLGIHYYPFSNNLGGTIDDGLLPYQDNGSEVKEIADNLNLLLEYLGLEIETGKRIVKKAKKGKK